MQVNKRRSLSVFSLVMINVIAIDSLRGIPMGAHYGLALIFIYVVFGFAFFIPSALVSAELATAWPQTGGIYVWVREAFGVPIAFLVSWVQWVYNICWYPTILYVSSGFDFLLVINCNYFAWYACFRIGEFGYSNFRHFIADGVYYCFGHHLVVYGQAN